MIRNGNETHACAIFSLIRVRSRSAESSSIELYSSQTWLRSSFLLRHSSMMLMRPFLISLTFFWFSLLRMAPFLLRNYLSSAESFLYSLGNFIRCLPAFKGSILMASAFFLNSSISISLSFSYAILSCSSTGRGFLPTFLPILAATLSLVKSIMFDLTSLPIVVHV